MLTHSLCDLVMFCVVMESGSRVPLIFAADSTGRVAQRIRRLTTNQKIVGSNPIVINFVDYHLINNSILFLSLLTLNYVCRYEYVRFPHVLIARFS